MNWSALAGIVCLGLAACVGGANPEARSAESQWMSDYSAARASSAKSGKPILAVLRCER